MELSSPEPDETEALLQDVLAFLEDATWSDTASTSSVRPKKRRKTPRDTKKVEKEALRSQITQFETQLELLRLQKPKSSTKSNWEWLDAATKEEERRQSAEEINKQLKLVLKQQYARISKFQELIIQQPALTQCVQELMAKSSLSTTVIPTVSFQNFGAIAAHVKTTVDQFRMEFSGWNSLDEALMSSVNVKNGDPPMLELQSATPLACRYEEGAQLLWDMLLEKKVLGSNTGSYRMKTTQLTQSSAEFGYSTVNSCSNGFGTLNGVTLFEKSEEEDQTVLLWASMMVEPDGKLFCSSQGYLSVTRLPSNPQQESLVRSSSRLAGKLFGLSGRSSKARQHLIASKTRLEHAQLRLMERAELQVPTAT